MLEIAGVALGRKHRPHAALPDQVCHPVGAHAFGRLHLLGIASGTAGAQHIAVAGLHGQEGENPSTQVDIVRRGGDDIGFLFGLRAGKGLFEQLQGTALKLVGRHEIVSPETRDLPIGRAKMP